MKKFILYSLVAGVFATLFACSTSNSVDLASIPDSTVVDSVVTEVVSTPVDTVAVDSVSAE